MNYTEGQPRIRVGELVKVTFPGFGGRVLNCQIVHVNEGKARFSLRPVHVKQLPTSDQTHGPSASTTEEHEVGGGHKVE